MHRRRFLALFAIVNFFVASAEATAGEVRVGGVYHEATVVAAAHRADQPRPGGHEDCTESTENRAGGHKHVAGSDHCSHHHGPAVSSSVGEILISPTVAIYTSVHDRVMTIDEQQLFHPPRA